MAPSRSLWIGNIDSAMSSEDLYLIFSQFGVIDSIRTLQDKECAFVNYANVEDAIKAKEGMQGGRIGNCIVRIGYGKVDAIHDAQGLQPTKSLWIGNIMPSTKPSDLEVIFADFGQVESARVLTHKNCGFVNFVKLEDAIVARSEMNGQEISGAVVKIGFAKVPSKADLAASAAILANGLETTNFLNRSPITESSNPWQIDHNSSPNTAVRSPGTPIGGRPTEAPASSSNRTIEYAASIPALPEPNSNRKVDQNRLRDMRKRLEAHCTTRDIDAVYSEIIDDAIDLCSDYIGNVIIQKIVEKCNDSQRQRLIEKVSPHLAAFGIHKNGTWAVQKIIECARTPGQTEAIVKALQRYTPPLLLDQFGNYVVQCCLKLGNNNNQFIFEAMQAKCWELGQGRFGARAMRTCLESQYTSKKQQKEVSSTILQNAPQLCMNTNGSILIVWLMDMSQLPGRYIALAKKLLPHIPVLCCHKMASATILKIGIFSIT